MSATGAHAGKLEFGAVLRETGTILGRNWVAFGAIAMISIVAAQVPPLLAPALGLTGRGTLAVLSGLSILVQLAAAFFAQAAIFSGVVDDQSGKQANFSDCLAGGMRGLLPALGAGLVSLFWFVLAYIFFVIPGLVVATALIVSTPAAVIERKGVFASITRSRQLTKGNRWAVFGLLLLFVLIYFVLISPILITVMGAGGALSGGAASSITLVLLGVAAGLGSTLLGSVGLAVLYLQLRNLQDGSGAQELAAVFD